MQVAKHVYVIRSTKFHCIRVLVTFADYAYKHRQCHDKAMTLKSVVYGSVHTVPYNE